MLAKFQDNMSLIKCKNFKFLFLKLCIKDGFLDRMENSIRLTLNLLCVKNIENMKSNGGI